MNPDLSIKSFDSRELVGDLGLSFSRSGREFKPFQTGKAWVAGISDIIKTLPSITQRLFLELYII